MDLTTIRLVDEVPGLEHRAGRDNQRRRRQYEGPRIAVKEGDEFAEHDKPQANRGNRWTLYGYARRECGAQ